MYVFWGFFCFTALLISILIIIILLVLVNKYLNALVKPHSHKSISCHSTL